MGRLEQAATITEQHLWMGATVEVDEQGGKDLDPGTVLLSYYYLNLGW